MVFLVIMVYQEYQVETVVMAREGLDRVGLEAVLGHEARVVKEGSRDYFTRTGSNVLGNVKMAKTTASFRNAFSRRSKLTRHFVFFIPATSESMAAHLAASDGT